MIRKARVAKCSTRLNLFNQQKFRLQFVFLFCAAPRAPSDEGKRSAVAVVNDSPVDCQSRDRIARRQLSAKLTGGEKKLPFFTTPQSKIK